MPKEGRRNRSGAVCLLAVLLLVWASYVQAAETLVSSRLQETFRSCSPVRFGDDNVGISFRTEDCPCFALTDSGSIVRYIFVFPPEKGRKSRQTQEKVRATAERLADFLEKRYGGTKLIPFSVPENGYVISIKPPRYTSYTYYSHFLNDQTYRFISRMIERGGIFHHFEDGELTIKMPGGVVESEACYLSLPVYNGQAEVVGFVPERSVRRSDEKIAESVAAVLKLSEPYTSDNRSSYSTLIKNMKNATGATKCIGVGYRWGMVLYRNRCYVGSEQDLTRFIRNKKRSNVFGKIDYPRQSDDIPDSADENTDKQTETTPSTTDRATEGGNGKITIEQICTFFHCTPPIVQDDCACLLIGNCRVVIPLPHKEKTDAPSLLRLPVRYVCIHTPAKEDGERLLAQYAGLMSFMLTATDFPPAKIADHPSDKTIKFLFFPTGIAPNAALEDKVKALLHADNFPDTEVRAWPEKNRAGKDIPDKWKELTTLRPDAQDNAKPLTPDAALKDYIEYLQRLMK